MSAEEVAAAFVNHFYSTFNQSVDALAGLYVRFIAPILYPMMKKSLDLSTHQLSSLHFHNTFAIVCFFNAYV